jgi:hypothetical protein
MTCERPIVIVTLYRTRIHVNRGKLAMTTFTGINTFNKKYWMKQYKTSTGTNIQPL